MKDSIFSWFLAAAYFVIFFFVLRFAFRGTLHILTDLHFLTPAAPRGRAGTWERV